jgi:hypothetical protein
MGSKSMNKQNIIAVDPGSPLYMALVNYKGELVSVTEVEHVAMKAHKGWENSPALIARVVKAWSNKEKLLPARMVVEQITARPHQAIGAMTKYTGSYWLMKGIAAALVIPFHDVSSRRWRDDLIMDTTIMDNKEQSRKRALELWPNKAHQFRYKKDHNKAEAALIGYWGVKYVLNNEV